MSVALDGRYTRVAGAVPGIETPPVNGASGFDSQISTTEPTAGFCDTWPFRDLFLCKTFMRSTECAL